MKTPLQHYNMPSVAAWREAAIARPIIQDDAVISARREALEQALANAALDGVGLDAQLVRDYELLVTGQMNAEEHRAFLSAVFAEAA